MPRLNPQAEKCRAHATKCRFLAKCARNKQQFLELAQQWEGLAFEIEDMARTRAEMSQQTAPNATRGIEWQILKSMTQSLFLYRHAKAVVPTFGTRTTTM